MNKGIDAQTRYLEDVDEEDCVEKLRETMESALESGFKYELMVVGGSQFGECVETILEETEGVGGGGGGGKSRMSEYREMKVVHLASTVPKPRVAVAYPGFHEVRFLQGLMCGKVTKTNTVGYVTAFAKENSGVARALAGFAVGVRMAKPNARIVLGLTGSFLNYVAERKATERVLEEGVDCIAHQQNDLTVNSIASSRGIWSVGFTSDARFFIDETVLSSIEFHWAPLIVNASRSILFNASSWNSSSLSVFQSLSTNTIGLTGYSSTMDPSWRLLPDHFFASFGQSLLQRLLQASLQRLHVGSSLLL